MCFLLGVQAFFNKRLDIRLAILDQKQISP